MGLATGFQYFYQDVLGLNPANVVCAFDFHTQSGDQIVNQPWVTNGVNGTIFGGSGGFYSPSGSGNFNGTRYVGLNSGVNLSDWTIFLTYQRGQSGRNDILVSTMSGNSFSQNSGMIFGINEANKVYLEFWNNVAGPQVYTFSEIISDKNMLGISKSDSTIFFNYYDCNSKKLTVEEFSIVENNFINSSTWNLGGRPAGNYWAGGSNLSGFIDNAVIISGTVDSSYIEILYSGFFKNPISQTLVTGLTCENIDYITGVATGIPGLVGYQAVQTSNIIDSCGRSQPIFTYSGVSGIVSGTTFITISINQCVINSGWSGDLFFVDSGYLYDFGYNQISLLWDIQSGDYANSVVLTGLFENTTRNKVARWNALNQQYFLDADYGTGNNIGLYLNGQLETFASGIHSYQVFYDAAYVISGDFFLRGNGNSRVYSTGFYQQNDVIIYDIVNGNISSFAFTGSNSGAAFSQIPSFAGKEIFLNGQLLASGVDWNLPNILNSQIDSGNNILSTYNITGNSAMVSGFNIGFLGFPFKFLRNSSQTSFNGVRLQNGINGSVVENSTYDLLSGSLLRPLFSDFLYLNSNDFINY